MWAKKEPEKKTRFTQCPEFKHISTLIEAIRIKKRQLAKHDKKGSIGCKKHTIMSNILTEFDKLINEFNKDRSIDDSKEAQLMEMGSLLIKFVLVIAHLKREELDTLFEPRNNKRRYVNNLLHYGFMGSVAIGGTALGGPLLGLGMFVCSGAASNAARKKAKINDITPKSAALLLDLLQDIIRVFKSIVDDLGDQCDLQPLTFEKNEWLPDNEEIDENNINPRTIYLQITKSSIKCVYKDKKGTIKTHSLDEFLDDNSLQQMREQKQLGFFQRVAILSAIYTNIYAPNPSAKEEKKNEEQVELSN